MNLRDKPMPPGHEDNWLQKLVKHLGAWIGLELLFGIATLMLAGAVVACR
jgi:hypothetical protein